ncbi:hypothetical protein [Campylobacter troglodytis]|nr:hypothetical protein [Campylobacter troglodytis]
MQGATNQKSLESENSHYKFSLSCGGGIFCFARLATRWVGVG